MPSPRETILTALHARLSALTVTALRGDVPPERVPSEGLLILRGGEPGEPEVTLSPLRYHDQHRAEIEAVVQGSDCDAAFDALTASIGAALAADRTLGGLCDRVAALPFRAGYFIDFVRMFDHHLPSGVCLISETGPSLIVRPRSQAGHADGYWIAGRKTLVQRFIKKCVDMGVPCAVRDILRRCGQGFLHRACVGACHGMRLRHCTHHFAFADRLHIAAFIHIDPDLQQSRGEDLRRFVLRVAGPPPQTSG
jgi:hypothetical protein